MTGFIAVTLLVLGAIAVALIIGGIVEALGTIEPSGWFERAIAGLLSAGYKQRLRAIVAAAPSWVSEEILSASEHIGDDRAVVGFGKN